MRLTKKGTINKYEILTDSSGRHYVVGETEEYPTAPDGTPISTSLIFEVVTSSGSIYRLGTPKPREATSR
jgi:hypothetical protein